MTSSEILLRSWRASLLTDASEPYRRAGRFAYFFARGKLRHDPVYPAILERGLLLGRARILDLGCGQALLTAWLRAAARLHERGVWPEAWPAAPKQFSVRGIELMPHDVDRARDALGADGAIEAGDIRCTGFEAADAVVLLDVMHYLDSAAQHDVLVRARDALPLDGLLLLRVCDADAGVRYRCTRWVDTAAMWTRGHKVGASSFRGIAEWQSVLRTCGFDSEAHPMSQGTPFANVLLIAHARSAPRVSG